MVDPAGAGWAAAVGSAGATGAGSAWQANTSRLVAASSASSDELRLLIRLLLGGEIDEVIAEARLLEPIYNLAHAFGPVPWAD